MKVTLRFQLLFRPPSKGFPEKSVHVTQQKITTKV